MKCAVHTDVDATGYCRNCGKPMCPVCVRPVRDVLYCEDCLASVMGHPAHVRPGRSRLRALERLSTGQALQCALPPGWFRPSPAGMGPNPALAFFLGFLPGLGAFYNEQYGKGMIHLAIFLFLFILGVDGALSGGAEAALWICIAALWVYMPIDAYRTAQGQARRTDLERSAGIVQQGQTGRTIPDHRHRRVVAAAQFRLVSVVAHPAVLAGDSDRRRNADVPQRRAMRRVRRPSRRLPNSGEVGLTDR